MPNTTKPARVPLVAVFFLLLIGTWSCSDKDDQGTAAESAHDTASEQSQPALSPEPAPYSTAAITAEHLSPVIRESGYEDEVPERIAVEFAVPIATRSQINRPTDSDTRLEITPPVAGDLEFTGPTTLSFKPKSILAPNTTYTVALKSVKSGDRVFERPSPQAWAYSFTTPPFQFVRISLRDVDKWSNKIDLDVVMSAPIAPAALETLANWAVDDTPVVRASYTGTAKPNVIRATLSADKIRHGKVELTLAKGVRLATDTQVQADAAAATLQLPVGEPVKIHALRRKEGTTGFYLDVICDDEAVSGRKRHYWDRDGRASYRLSRRCVLDESDARNVVHFNPAVDFNVAPSRAGFRLIGKFSRGNYTLRIDPGARTIDGGALHEPYESTFSIPARSTKINFVKKGRYLPRKAWRSLPVSHLNASETAIEVRHIRPDNLVFWMSGPDEKASDRTGDLLLSTRVTLQGKPDIETTSWIDIGSMLPDIKQGVFEITLKSGNSQDAARLLLTDINLIAKRSAADPGDAYSREVTVWAIDAHTVGPLSGVNMRLITKSNRTLAVCSTDRSGMCRLQAEPIGLDKSPPFAIVAQIGGDSTYIRYSDLKVAVEGETVTGESYASAKAYHAAIYADRGVYRPGDTAHLVSIIRDRSHLAPPAELPVTFKILDPRGKSLKQAVLKTNAAGMIVYDMAFADFAATGQYHAKVFVANHEIAAYAFNVEEFVPERMKVTADAKADAYHISETPAIEVGAAYLFGGSAEGSRVEVTCDLLPSVFKPKQNANFHYGVWQEKGSADKSAALGTATGEIDKHGRVTLGCPAAKHTIGFQGAARLKAQVAVFEAGSGRTTTNQAYAAVHPERYYLGLVTGIGKAQVGKPFNVSGIVVDWDGKALDTVRAVNLEFLRLEEEYGYFYDTERGHERWQRLVRPASIGRKQIAVKDGKFETSFTPTEAATGYIVRAVSGQARTDLRLDGDYRHYYWASPHQQVDATPRPLKPTSLTIEAPAVTRVNKSTTIKFTAPYKGRVLLTVETNKVLRAEWKEVDAGEVAWSFELDKFVPNVYVAALLVKDPHLDSKDAYLPDRAFGIRNIRVEPFAFQQTVSVKAPAEIEPGKTLTVDIAVEDAKDTYVTVAAVDEGILSLTKFKDPDPLSSIFFRRALGIDTFETVGWMLLVPPMGPSRSPGGGSEEDSGGPGRVQAIKPVALWSGVTKVGTDGRARVSFEIPQYQGKLRVMAVGVNPRKMGSASTAVTVRSPLVAQTTLPRFLAAGDEFEIPVFVTNMTGAKQTVNVSLAAENLPVFGQGDAFRAPTPIKILGAVQQQIELAHQAGGRVVFKAVAEQQVGAATVRVKTQAGKFVTEEKLDVPFYPTAPRAREFQRIELDAGPVDLRQYLQGWLPTTETTTFFVTNKPYGEVFDHLKFLLRYPYGCIEQTTSTTRPLLFLSDLINNVDPASIEANGSVTKMIEHGVNRILSMQTPEGGFGFWPGHSAPNPWGTAYATHLLLDAQKLNYPVPKDRLEEALGYIERTLTSGSRANRSHYASAAGTEAYMHYVLALAGRGHKAAVGQLIDQMGQVDSGEEKERLYLLQAALYLSGDHRYERDLKNPDLSAVSDERKNNWSFYSDRRRRGFMLSIFGDLFGDDPAGERLAQLVAATLSRHRSYYYSTQELVWGITGLGKRVVNLSADFEPPVLKGNGKPITPKHVPQQAKLKDRSWTLYRASEYDSLMLDVKDKGKGKLFLLISSEGIRKDADYRTGGDGLAIEKRFLAPDGTGVSLDGDGQPLGGLVVVELTVTNKSFDRIQNIALVDRLPSGWEVENPRLGRSRVVEWVNQDDLWNIEFMNVRDDRVEFFGALEARQSKKIIFMARAVTAGNFAMPPAEAEAMYDPAIWARQKAGRLKIQAPWQ